MRIRPLDKYNHVMVDLETLGMDANGIFTALGACQFDMEGNILGTFKQYISWESSLEAGRTITPDTLKWWMNQSKEAQFDISQPGEHITEVLAEFADWLPEHPQMWGNGPEFDIVMLANAYGGWSKAPWSYKNIQSTRTMRLMTEDVISLDDVEFVGVPHSALDDAIFQAKYVGEMYRYLNDVTI